MALILPLNFTVDSAIRLCLLSRIEYEFDLSNRHAIVNVICKYLIIHSPQGFSGIIYNTGRGTLPDCLRCSLQVMKK